MLWMPHPWRKYGLMGWPSACGSSCTAVHTRLDHPLRTALQTLQTRTLQWVLLHNIIILLYLSVCMYVKRTLTFVGLVARPAGHRLDHLTLPHDLQKLARRELPYTYTKKAVHQPAYLQMQTHVYMSERLGHTRCIQAIPSTFPHFLHPRVFRYRIHGNP